MKEKLSNLKLALESPSVDDSTKRDYFMTLIKSYVYQSLDDLNGIENEKPMIEFMEARKKGLLLNLQMIWFYKTWVLFFIIVGGNEEDKKPKIPPPPLRPIIITKDAVQKAVFGYGYPSLPVMSIEDFYEQRVKDGR